MEHAPYFSDVAQGPATAAAYWLTGADGVRIRVGVWPEAQTRDAKNNDGGAARGTVFMFPGRTECVEKYARSAQDFAERGYASLAVDWRGQGIADRLLEDRAIGHVERFSDYQHDVDCVYALANALDLPKPWYVIGHSMGGAIGLNALMRDHPFSAAAFSAPMWGIGLSTAQKLLVKLLLPLLKLTGTADRRAAGTKPETYMLWQPFEGNKLTSDPEMYSYMRDQIVAHPDLGLGGPSAQWVETAMTNCAHFTVADMPDMPALCFLGGDEEIVNTDAVRRVAGRWESCTLIDIPKARHEIMMETPEIRTSVMDACIAHFEAHRD